MGYVWHSQFQGQFGSFNERSFSLSKIRFSTCYVFKVAGVTVKRSKVIGTLLTNIGKLLGNIIGTFNLVLFNVISGSFSELVLKRLVNRKPKTDGWRAKWSEMWDSRWTFEQHNYTGYHWQMCSRSFSGQMYPPILADVLIKLGW